MSEGLTSGSAHSAIHEGASQPTALTLAAVVSEDDDHAVRRARCRGLYAATRWQPFAWSAAELTGIAASCAQMREPMGP